MRSLKLFLAGIVLALAVLFSTNCGDSSSGDSGSTKHCTDFDYPLWCPDAGVCCPRGKPVYCDGMCYEQDPGGCTFIDRCYEE